MRAFFAPSLDDTLKHLEALSGREPDLPVALYVNALERYIAETEMDMRRAEYRAERDQHVSPHLGVEA